MALARKGLPPISSGWKLKMVRSRSSRICDATTS